MMLDITSEIGVSLSSITKGVFSFVRRNAGTIITLGGIAVGSYLTYRVLKSKQEQSKSTQPTQPETQPQQPEQPQLPSQPQSKFNPLLLLLPFLALTVILIIWRIRK